jgi:hypothetical protein
MSNSNNILLEIGIDKNDDKEYNTKIEPTILKKFNLDNFKYEEVLKKEVYDQLQSILDGKLK